MTKVFLSEQKDGSTNMVSPASNGLLHIFTNMAEGLSYIEKHAYDLIRHSYWKDKGLGNIRS